MNLLTHKSLGTFYVSHACFLLFVALLISFLSILPVSAANPQKTIYLNTSAEPPLTNDKKTGILDQIYTEAFARLGYKVHISRLSAERAMLSVNNGIDDGKYIKIAGLSRLFPKTLQVTEKSMDYEFVGFSKNIKLQTTGWETLKPYNVAIINGWKILEKNIVGTASLKKVKNARLLFGLLDNNRADIVIYARLEGYALIKEMGLKGVDVLEPPLATKGMYLYMNEKHKDLVEKVSKTLREMKEDGAYKKIFNRAMKPYLED
ncbi:MAG: transporter substrate-binding domain-containing protein [Magnetococcales bacterium]|nr:transporter substrate-binding domain-containing protein [Magnetococcales bacterium]